MSRQASGRQRQAVLQVVVIVVLMVVVSVTASLSPVACWGVTFDWAVIEQPGQAALSQKKVGDPIEVRLAAPNAEGISAPAWISVETEQESDLLTAGWTIEAGPGKLTLTAIRAGRLTLPTLALKDEEGSTVGTTHPFSFEIQTAIAKDDPRPNQPEDLIPPVRVKFPLVSALLRALGVVLLLAALLYALLRAWRKVKRKDGGEEDSGVVLSPWEAAQLSLKELQKQGELEQLHFKPFYFRLSEILKAYLGAQLGFDALESTSAEVLAFLQAQPGWVLPLLQSELGELLERLDRVKFTDYLPKNSEEGAALFQLVESWMERLYQECVGSAGVGIGVEALAVASAGTLPEAVKEGK